MQPAKDRSGACQQGTEDYPQDEERMQQKEAKRKQRIEARSGMHS